MLRSYFHKFNRGEVDEKAMARDDVERIVDSASLMENWVPQRLGPMQYRAGTEYLDFSVSNIGHYMIPFLSQGDESAVMEFSAANDATGTNTLQIWINDAIMAMTATVDTITNNSFASDITGWTDDSDAGGQTSWDAGGHMSISGNGSGDWGRSYQTNTLTAGERTVEVWIAEAPVYFAIGTAGSQSDDVFGGWLNPGYHALTFTATATDYTYTFQNDKAFQGLVSSCSYHAGGDWSITAEFFVDDSTTGEVLDTVRYAQSADTMYLTTNGFELGVGAWPYILFKRRGTKSWTFELPENTEGPFGPINDTSITLTPGATSGNTTLTSSVGIFKADAFGDIYELIHGATVGRCKVTAYTSSTVCQVRVTSDFGGTSATLDWYKGLFGYGLPGPTAVEMFEGRMWLAGAGFVHASVADQYTNFDARLEGAEAAILKTIGFGTVQDITWMLGGDQLLLGLSSEELTLNSNEFGDIITPTNARIRRATSHGSAVMKPMVINKVIYFAQRALKKIISITGMDKKAVETEDITLLTPEILSPGIQRMVFVGEPEPRIWVLLTDGELRVFLFDKAENVRGWSRITIGGGGTIVDIVSTPTNEQDAVYVIVDRSGTRTMEKFANFEDAIGQSDSRHYDSHIYFSSPGLSASGLDHLEGLTVNIWGDGVDRQVALVTAGVVTLPIAWADVVIGVRHTAKYLSNRLGKYLNNSVLTDEKRVVRMGLIMQAVALRTIKYGPSESLLQNMPEIEEGRLRAPTEEPEAQIKDSITDLGPWNIQIKDTHAYNSCQELPSIPEPHRDQFSVYYNGAMYIVGGRNPVGGSGSKELWKYTIDGGVMERLSDAHIGLAQHTVCEHDGQIFTITADGTHALMVYTIATDTWETGISQPTTAYTQSAIAAYNGKVYMYGGNSGGTPQTTWGIYDITGDSWDYTAVLGSPLARMFHSAAAPQAGTGAGEIYFFGGYEGGGLTDSQLLTKYKISTNTFSTVLNSGNQAKGGPSKIDVDDAGTLYNYGGRDRVGGGLPSEDPAVYSCDLSSPAWAVLDSGGGTGGTDRPYWSSNGHGMIYDPVNDELIVYGGYSNENAAYNREMWSFDLSTNDWTLLHSPLAGTGGALRVVDISDIELLSEASSLNLESADQDLRGYASVIDGDYLYMIVAEDNDDNRGIAVVDISDPTAPSQVGYLQGGTNTSTIGRAIWKDGDYVYMPSFATNGYLASIDVSDPTTPVLADELQLVHTTNAVNSEKMAMVWPRLYVPWENALHIVDVSIPTTLTLESKFTLSAGNLNSQCRLETDAVLWVVDDTGILGSYSLADPAVPTLIGGLVDAVNLLAVQDFDIIQPYLYAMRDDGASVIDLTDPSVPVHFINYTGFADMKSIATTGGNILFAGAGTTTDIFYAADQRSNRYVDYDERPFEFDGTFDTDSRVYLQAHGPATVLAITYDVEDSDNEADDFYGPRNN